MRLYKPANAGKIIIPNTKGPRVIVKGRRVRPRGKDPLITASLRPHEMAWEVLDKHGNVVRAGESFVHNLVLNKTWDDLIAAYGFYDLSKYVVVGTGNSDPDATQTALDNPVAHTSAVPSGEHDSLTYLGSGTYEISRIRQFTSDQVGGQNLTEWGWSPTSSDSDVGVRELFRDSNGDPVTITVDADQSLRLLYKQQVTVSPEPMTGVSADFDLQNIGTFSGTFWLSQKGSGAALGFVDKAARGFGSTYTSAGSGIGLNRKLTDIVATDHTTTDVAYNAGHAVPFATYNSGDRFRSTETQTISENDDNATWYGLVYLLNDYYTDPWNSDLDGLWFDWGDTLDKDNLHRLIINAFTVVSWGP